MSVTKERIESLNLGGLGAKAEADLKQLLLEMSGNASATKAGAKAQPVAGQTKRRIL